MAFCGPGRGPSSLGEVNPFRSRVPRTIILTLSGYLFAWLLALFLAPRWPGFCEDAVSGLACTEVAVQTMMGYLLVALGMLTIVFGPIAGSLLDLAINGATWETPRGRENVITNIPILIGAIYLASGIALLATA